MYDDELPELDERPKHLVLPYVTGIFGKKLVKLEEHDDGRYRAIFTLDYFTLSSDEHTEPTKSQWSTLKKKMKRHNKGVFIFREQGTADCAKVNTNGDPLPCFYIDFGFFRY